MLWVVTSTSIRRLHIPHAAETGVAGGAVRRVPAARRQPIPIAVRLVAEVRAAADHPHRPERRPTRILEPARRKIPAEPVGAPLPGVAAHVVEAEAVRRERINGGGAVVAVIERVVRWERAVPDVASLLAAGRQVIPPRIALLFEAAARGVLPLRLRRQALAGPRAVHQRVI